MRTCRRVLALLQTLHTFEAAGILVAVRCALALSVAENFDVQVTRAVQADG